MLLAWMARIRIDPRRLRALKWVHQKAHELMLARKRLAKAPPSAPRGASGGWTV